MSLEFLASYDAENPKALRKLVGAGVQLRPFSADVMDAALNATNELYDEISATNLAFKMAIDAVRRFRDEEYLWFQVAEYAYDSFMIRSRRR